MFFLTFRGVALGFSLTLESIVCVRTCPASISFQKCGKWILFECTNNLQGFFYYVLLQFLHDFWIETIKQEMKRASNFISTTSRKKRARKCCYDCAHGHHDAAFQKKHKSYLLNVCILFFCICISTVLFCFFQINKIATKNSR